MNETKATGVVSDVLTPEAIAGRVKKLDAKMKKSGKESVMVAKEVGGLLLQARNKVKADKAKYGKWSEWIEAHVGYKQQHAGAFILIFQRWEMVEPGLDDMRGIADAIRATRGKGKERAGRSIRLDKDALEAAVGRVGGKMSATKVVAVFEALGITIKLSSRRKPPTDGSHVEPSQALAPEGAEE